MAMIVSSGRFGAAAWGDAVGPFSQTSDSADWVGYTLLVVFDDGIVTPGGTQVRVTFKAGSAEGGNITNAYIGHAAGAGDAYDFEAAPTQLLFSGAAGVNIGVGATVVSDPVTFTIQAAKNLIVAFRSNGDTGADSFARNLSVTGADQYHKNANDAATVDKTGYTLNSAGATVGVLRIESLP